METISLFPLNIVLFPDSSLPLHIFEPQYKELINLCFQNRTLFGINLTESGKLSEIGCAAGVSNIVKRYRDGRLDIEVTGAERFRLKSFTGKGDACLIGNIEYLPDTSESVRFNFIAECTEYYNRNIRTAFQKSSISVAEVAVKKYPSYFLAEKAGLSLSHKQSLLESRSENHRLETLLRHFKEIEPIKPNSAHSRKIIECDGYLPRARI
ncbi:MAG: LON peptidase substrate-binding domain-containing protein [Bacteroidetes bacterium]|nr:LON peptidase substrate-binding domain-containing protein [Bacteroidota bacterium]MCZ2102412.1 LON peptidase substrate-binding domain-containing protein [Chitinophagales bacterium]